MYHVPRYMPNGEEYVTSFQMDFDIADHFGIKAVKDTFERAFKSWRSDIEYVTELAITLNLRSWFWCECPKRPDNMELSKLYADLYYKVRDWVYSKKASFTQEDLDYYFRMTD